ncbi:MAG: anthranilate synthase component I, partial [Burkholderiales bacterium]|nr:anthranilate synthase component I [Burkholderiales bacterium]
MTEEDFQRLADQGCNRIPLAVETFSDLDTPLSVYLKLANEPYTYLLESVQGGERWGRYSFIGLRADTRFEVVGQTCREYRDGALIAETQTDDPLDFVQAVRARYRAPATPGLPRFCGGLVGCFGYETVRFIEPRLAAAEKPDVLRTPDILLLLSDQLAVFDNLAGKLFLIVYCDPG